MRHCTEAGLAWREYAFTTLDLQRIVSMISEENSASRRVAEKLRDESRASGDLGWGSAADVRLRSDRVAFDVIGRDAALTLDPALDDLLGARVRPGGGVVTVAGVVGLEGGRAVGTYGEAGDGRPPDAADSVFEIGSAEKVLTGTLLAEMIGRGEVALTDRVDDFLPSSVAVPSWKGHPIRLVDLATHTSGLPRLPTNLPISDPDNPLADYAVDQLYAFLSNYKLTRDVGAGYEYSNVGFGLLGHVLALRAGTTFAKLLRDRLLDPLGLATTSHRLTPAMARRLAIPHHEFGDVVPRWENPTLVGTGGLLSTIGDMLSFAAANIAAPTDRLRRAMAAAREPRYTRPDGVRVGLGWHTRRPDDRDVIWISGETGGSRSFIGLDPPRRAAVVLNNSAQSVNDVGFHLLDERLNLNAPEHREEIVLPPAVLHRYVGVYELGPDRTITVTESPHGLTAQATGIGRASLHPRARPNSSSSHQRASHVRAGCRRRRDRPDLPPSRQAQSCPEVGVPAHPGSFGQVRA